jgi:hypothetical protein
MDYLIFGVDLSTAVRLESVFLTLGGDLILFLLEDILQRYGYWSAVMLT